MGSLSEFLAKGKAELIRANKDRRHDFRFLTLVTKADYPAARTVVKRSTSETLVTLIYTDSRSAKIEQLKSDPRCSQLYYHSKKKLQVIIESEAELLTAGDLYDQHLEIALNNEKDYTTTLAPGSPISEAEYQYSAEHHFTLIQLHPISLEILELGKPQHRRARFTAQTDWSGTWLVP